MFNAVILSMIIVNAAANDSAQVPISAGKGWHEDAFFGLHYDLHPNASDTELGRETTYEHIREQLEKVKPDFVQYDCKGHPGYAGYPTKVGSPSPGIVHDALKVWRQVTKDMGIPLSIHYSGVWDSRAIELQSDWARVKEEGGKDTNNTCPLSPYTEQLLIPQLIEVVDNYDVDGMWVDGENWASNPCYCKRCTAEFTRRTGILQIPRKRDDKHWFEWLAVQRDYFTEHVNKYVTALKQRKPALQIVSNWMYSVRQPEPMTVNLDYLSGDFDPSFGSERACAEARFISSRGKPWDLMAWAFLRTSDQPWTMKPAPHLCQELAEVMAQGGAVFIYDQPQRSGRVTSWHQDILGQVAEFCRDRKEFCHKTETIPQVAILHSETFFYKNNQPLFNFASANQPMEGALHAVLENGYSADVLNEDSLLKRLNEYPMVVVAEQEGISSAVVAALRTYVTNGGQLLVSGANVAQEYPDLAGVTAADGQLGSGYVPAGNGCVAVPGPWQKVQLAGATECAPLLTQQEVELNKAGTPAATVYNVGAGRVVAIHGPVFRSYLRDHYPLLRQFIGDALAQLGQKNLIHVDGPWWVEMVARKRDGKQLIQFINRSAGGYTAPNRHVVESVPNTGAFTVRIPMEARPKRCHLAPDATAADWNWTDGLLTVKIAGLEIHNVLVIEP